MGSLLLIFFASYLFFCRVSKLGNDRMRMCDMIWRCPKLRLPLKSSKLDHSSFETHGLGDPPG